MFSILLLLVCLSWLGCDATREAEVLHEWVTLQYTWESAEQEANFSAQGLWKPENNALAGLKAYKDELYVTVPRWRSGVPATLNKVVTIDGVSLLQPYPSWEFNDFTKPDSLRYVQSMEIDQEGRMWIIDAGRLFFFDDEVETVNGPARLIVYDMQTNEIIRDFLFPHSVLPHDDSFLNDIVLDQARGYAYMSDHARGAVIIYSFTNNQAARWENGPGMAYEPDAVPLTFDGIEYPDIKGVVNGIALTPDTEWLYYCPLTGYNLTKIRTVMLRELVDGFYSDTAVVDSHAIFAGSKAGSTDGMTFDSQGNLYYAAFELGGTYVWTNAENTDISNQEPLVPNDWETLTWVDTFGFDDEAHALLFTSNKLQTFFAKTMDFNGTSGANFRILRVPLGNTVGSYLSVQATYSPPVYNDAASCGCCGCTKAQFDVLLVIVILLLVLISAYGLFLLYQRKGSTPTAVRMA